MRRQKVIQQSHESIKISGSRAEALFKKLADEVGVAVLEPKRERPESAAGMIRIWKLSLTTLLFPLLQSWIPRPFRIEELMFRKHSELQSAESGPPKTGLRFSR